MNPGGGKKSHDWFSPGRFAALLALLIAASFFPVLTGSETFVVRDYGLFSYPVACFHRDSFWRGEIPLWNPLTGCGLPFLAQFNTMALYPLSLIYLLLPLPWSLSFFCLVHLFIAGMGMYFLARFWTRSNLAGAVAGLMFAFSGLTLNFLQWPSHLAGFSWIPWVILAVQIATLESGRKIILAALAAAMQIFAGSPESIFFTWLILGALVLLQLCEHPDLRAKILYRIVVIGLTAGLLSAAQFLPFFDLVAHSQRDKNFATTDWSMPAWGWANFFLPMFRGNYWQTIFVQPGQLWTTSYYPGIIGLLFASFALMRERSAQVWLCAFLFFTGVLLAMGDHTWFYPALRKLIPGLGFARYPVKFVMLSLIVAPVLAAYGAARLEKSLTGKKTAWFIAAGFSLVIFSLLAFALTHPVEGVSARDILKNGLLRVFFLLAILVALKTPWQKWAGLSVLLLLWLDLLSHTPWQNPGVDPSVYDRAFVRQKLKLDPEPAPGESRVLLSPYAMTQIYYQTIPNVRSYYLLNRLVFLSSCNLIDRIPKADGMASMYPRETDLILRTLTAQSPRLEQLEDLLSVSQTIAPGKTFDWVPRPTFLPMISAGQKPVFADESEALHTLISQPVNLHEIVFLPKTAAAAISAGRSPEAKISAKNFSAKKISFDVDAPAPALVFISQAYYHHWHARIDGSLIPLWRANVAFAALQAPAGRHHVTLDYEDNFFTWGAAISLTTLLGCGVAWRTRRPSSA